MTILDEEARSRQLVEAAREREWKGAGFMRDLFLGRFRLELIHPFPMTVGERPAFRRFYDELERFLLEEVDPGQIDASGEYPEHVLQGLRRLGAFGMKIPVEYGGLGFNQVEYGKIMQLLGSYDANITALLSAHQSIGVPQPLKLFGTEEQKRRYLPRCAAGAISAFALTETTVGSDPAGLLTTATPSADGRTFILEGDKLWCTNGTLAELLVVMARDPRTNAINAFIVETGWQGVEVTHRCRFMGLRALANGTLSFRSVRVPRENLLGKEGKGLKIALTTLNTGRLTLPAATVGISKRCLEICRKWASVREQWGRPIGEHEFIAHKIAAIAATTYAMESVSDLAQELADRKGYDIRLEAAAAKEWNTWQSTRLLDDTLQLRGGRGYETAQSLAARGEAPLPVEQMNRDARINLIFEGSSEIMHLFIAREAVDQHLKWAGVLIDRNASVGKKLAALPGIVARYVPWYLKQWVGWGRWPRYSSFGKLAPPLRFVNRASRKLARQIFHAMLVFRAGTERRQAFLFKLVDIGNELLAIGASVARAERLRQDGRPEAPGAAELAHGFSLSSELKVRALFRSLWRSHDKARFKLGLEVLEGRYDWLEKGAIPLGLSMEELRPRPPRELPEPGEQAPPPAGAGEQPAQVIH
ncbi:MAG: acyl-CoA dehydrogenase family protein [Myxococcaceae bacterium]